MKRTLFLFWSLRETTDHNTGSRPEGWKRGCGDNTNPHGYWDQILTTAHEQKGPSQQGHQQAAVPAPAPSRGVTLNSPLLGQKDFFGACLSITCATARLSFPWFGFPTKAWSHQKLSSQIRKRPPNFFSQNLYSPPTPPLLPPFFIYLPCIALSYCIGKKWCRKTCLSHFRSYGKSGQSLTFNCKYSIYSFHLIEDVFFFYWVLNHFKDF